MGRASPENGTVVPQSRTLSVPLFAAVRQAMLVPVTTKFARSTGMVNAFKSWIGQPVVLQVALGDIKVPLRGKLLKDGDDTVRMRIGEGWDVDIYKAMILAVEQDATVLLPS